MQHGQPRCHTCLIVCKDHTSALLLTCFRRDCYCVEAVVAFQRAVRKEKEEACFRKAAAAAAAAAAAVVVAYKEQQEQR